MLFKVSEPARRAMLLAVILLGPGLPAAFGVTLAWNASTDTSVTAYALHYGTVSGKLTTTVEAGKATTASVTSLSPGSTYYFNVVARNGAGLESMPSSEVSYTVPGTPTPNRPPTLNAIGNLTVGEDAPAQTVALSGIGSGSSTESQTLTVTASSSNTGLIPTPSLSYSSPNATGTLTFTPAPNASGTATLSVTVNDGQAQSNTITRSFTVTVSAVNDPPTLNALSNLSLNTTAGPQTVALSGIGSGAANESQTLVVTASQNNPSLLTGLSVSYTSPAATGTLAFTPVAGATGTATITVSANDGGASNNVVSRSFTVTVSTNTSRTLFLEAESGTLTAPMVMSSDAQASNGQRVSSPTAEAGSLDLALNITQAGDYYAWCRVLSSDAGNDSFYVSLDGGVADVFDTLTNYSSAWQWVQLKGRTLGTPRVLTLSQGTHHLVFKCREAQTLLDAIYLSTDRNFVPAGASANQPPTLNALSNLTLSEDALAQTVALSGIGSGSSTESQTLAVTAVSSNPGLIPNPTVSYASPSATGSLSFKPVANASGTATITVTVNDGQSVNNLFSRSFLVTVSSVNDAPVVNAGADRTVTLPATLALAGSVTDDAPGWTAAWSKVSGLGSVTFTPSGNPVCTAGFSLPGTYILRLTANDGSLSASDDISVTVLAAGDVTGPVVSGLRVAGNNARGVTLAWT
ncbi:MAG TPA: Ig-like domain-containing protein, partial [Candidatus Saccharimonadales bacterium]|nr:Ig-like domain-containing protein [Candidatus Saccharimonadales bacterium]